MLQKVDSWHQTKLGLLTFVVLELAIMYGFASLAIDRGNLWWYLLTLLFLIGSVRNFSRLILKLVPQKATHV